MNLNFNLLVLSGFVSENFLTISFAVGFIISIVYIILLMRRSHEISRDGFLGTVVTICNALIMTLGGAAFYAEIKYFSGENIEINRYILIGYAVAMAISYLFGIIYSAKARKNVSREWSALAIVLSALRIITLPVMLIPYFSTLINLELNDYAIYAIYIIYVLLTFIPYTSLMIGRNRYLKTDSSVSIEINTKTVGDFGHEKDDEESDQDGNHPFWETQKAPMNYFDQFASEFADDDTEGDNNDGNN